MESVSNIIPTALLLTTVLLTSCNDTKDNYPENYVGFEKGAITHYYDSKNQEESIEIKIIAVDKENTDRVVKLSATSADIPGKETPFRLVDKQLVIKADKKSVSTQIIIDPKQTIRHSFIQVTCTPQWKDAKISQLVVRLERKE